MSGKNLAKKLLSGLVNSPNSCAHHARDVCPSPVVKPRVLGYSTNSGEDDLPDYAFQMHGSTIRFGVGVTAEVGMDLQNKGAKNTLIITDSNVSKTAAFDTALGSIKRANLKCSVWDKVSVEPTETSWLSVIEDSRKGGYDSFVAVGGGSCMDTAKCAALMAANKDADLYDFVNKPFGKMLRPNHGMLPLIAVPTTAGTGSEATTIAVMDIERLNIKTAIRQPEILPHLALVDPLNMTSMPRHVTIYSGFDVLCHALESYTARPFYERRPRPKNPIDRPVFTGSNPISDVWSKKAMEIIKKYFRRSVADNEDLEARSNMLLAATFAGMGFGNAGVALPHALSYPIAGMGKSYVSPDYNKDHPLVPHGLAVVLTAPADFEFTGEACPERHFEAAEFLGYKGPTSDESKAGPVVADTLRELMSDFKVANGLKSVGFSSGDAAPLAKATFESKNQALSIAPRAQTEEQLATLFENSMTAY